MGLVPFLQRNPLVFTFELTDMYDNAVREIEDLDFHDAVLTRPQSAFGPVVDPIEATDQEIEDDFTDYLEEQLPELPVGPHVRQFLKLVDYNRDLQPVVQAETRRRRGPDPYEERWLERTGKPVPAVLDFYNTQSTQEAPGENRNQEPLFLPSPPLTTVG